MIIKLFLMQLTPAGNSAIFRAGKVKQRESTMKKSYQKPVVEKREKLGAIAAIIVSMIPA